MIVARVLFLASVLATFVTASPIPQGPQGSQGHGIIADVTQRMCLFFEALKA